LIKPTIFNWD